jgi:hypothetical protein
MIMQDYGAFIASKTRSHRPSGFKADVSGYGLFPFQASCVEWALHLGKAALFEDTGLGKTIQQLVWAHEVVTHTSGRVLLLAPLAVTEQTRREAAKFGIPDVRVVRDGSAMDGPGIYITNYERLHLFDPMDFIGVVLDESSILKNVFGRTRRALCAFAADLPYRLCCSATPAPNDHTELGNHSEFLGLMGEAVMRARWFINDLSETVAPWRLKKHAEDDFWAWVASWARCVGKPSDVGQFDDTAYDLPELHQHIHMVEVDIEADRADGMLFRVPDLSATAIHGEKRRTTPQRSARVAELVATAPDEPWAVWCETNYEQDELCRVLPHAIDVRGSMSPEEKAKRLLRFTDEGGVIVTKPKIAGMGLNWQHCARMAFVGGSYSYEAFYQTVRRAWRFGQTRPVDAHIVMATTEAAMWTAIQRKASGHERMKEKMFTASRRAAASHISGTAYVPTHSARLPTWLRSADIGE